MKRKEYQWQLPPEIERRLGDSTYGRQRAIFEADHLLLVLHAPPSADDLHRECLVFLRTPDGRYFCNGQENGEAKLKALLASYQTLLQRYEKAYALSKEAKDLFGIIEAVAPVSHAAGNLRNAVQSARELVREDRLLIAVRDEAYDLARNLELLLSDAKTALDYRIAEHAEAQADRAEEMTVAQHKLNVLAALTFPLMAIATIFGMNLLHGMEDQSPLFFWVVFAMGLVVGALTKGWVTNMKKATKKIVAGKPDGA